LEGRVYGPLTFAALQRWQNYDDAAHYGGGYAYNNNNNNNNNN